MGRRVVHTEVSLMVSSIRELMTSTTLVNFSGVSVAFWQNKAKLGSHGCM